MRHPLLLGILLGLISTLLPASARAACDLSGLPEGAEVAELVTTRGSICIELLSDDAPGHVENFLYYLEGGLIDGTVFHRSVPGFVLQGGGFTLGETDFEPVTPRGETVFNEPCTADTVVSEPLPGECTEVCSARGNTRGTVALAKGSEVNSGSTNWFINLSDNRRYLDCASNGAFTVFGNVIGGTMAVVDDIASLPTGEDGHFWTDSAYATWDTFTFPMLEPPDFGDGDYGCWDPTRQGTVVIYEFGQIYLVPDPFFLLAPFQVSVGEGCATEIDPATFVANPGGPTCVDPTHDVLAVGTTGPLSLRVANDPPRYYALTCEVVNAMLTEREVWRTAFKQSFRQQIEEQLIYVPSASLSVVPEPSAGLLTGAALLTLSTMRRSKRPARDRRRGERPPTSRHHGPMAHPGVPRETIFRDRQDHEDEPRTPHRCLDSVASACHNRAHGRTGRAEREEGRGKKEEGRGKKHGDRACSAPPPGLGVAGRAPECCGTSLDRGGVAGFHLKHRSTSGRALGRTRREKFTEEFTEERRRHEVQPDCPGVCTAARRGPFTDSRCRSAAGPGQRHRGGPAR